MLFLSLSCRLSSSCFRRASRTFSKRFSRFLVAESLEAGLSRRGGGELGATEEGESWRNVAGA